MQLSQALHERPEDKTAIVRADNPTEICYAKIPGKSVQVPELRCIVHGRPSSGSAFNTLLPDNVPQLRWPIRGAKGAVHSQIFPSPGAPQRSRRTYAQISRLMSCFVQCSGSLDQLKSRCRDAGEQQRLCDSVGTEESSHTLVLPLHDLQAIRRSQFPSSSPLQSDVRACASVAEHERHVFVGDIRGVA